MDSHCYLLNCTQLTSQTIDTQNKCNVPVTAMEDIDGCEFNLLVEKDEQILTSSTGMNELPGGVA
jgi:hypothetical protein